MGFVAKDNGGGADFKPTPSGNHVARCVQMIDLGTQYSQFYDKHSHKILVGWELPNEPDGDHGPHMAFKRYTLSLHENATLRRDMESWRGRKYTEDEAKGVDVSKVIGQPCMINVSHDKKDGGKVYANVDAVAPLPKGMDCPKQITPTIIFDIDNPDMAVFETFSDNLKRTITESEEWKARAQVNGKAPSAGGRKPAAVTYDDIPEDDEIPF